MKTKVKSIIISIVALLIFCTVGFNRPVVAADNPILVVTESPQTGVSLTNTVEIKGWSIAKAGVQKIEIAVDGTTLGQATYGIARQDIANAYPNYPNAVSSGFSFNLNTRKLINGQHVVKVTTFANDGSSLSNQISVTTSNQQTYIMGQAKAAKSQMIKYFLNNNSIKGFDYINNFVSILMEEASNEGVRADTAFAQMMKETNFLKFTGTVKEEQNNFAGIGATGGGVTGASFPDIRTGIRAVIQHLKAYGSTEPLKSSCVDPRFKYVVRGNAPIVEWLGIQENPKGYGWASDTNYGYDIVDRANYILTLQSTDNSAKITGFSAESNVYTNKVSTITATGVSNNKVMYQFWIYDYSTGIWSLGRDYSESNTYDWTPTKAGNYRIDVHIKDQYSVREYDDTAFKLVTVNDSAIAKNAALNIPQELIVNKESTITASGNSENKVLYQLWIYDYNAGAWNLIKDYSEVNSFLWTPKKAGNYRIEVHIKDVNSKNEFDDKAFSVVEAKAVAPATITSFTVDPVAFVGKASSITGVASSQNKTLYQFWIYDYNVGQWSMVKDYSESNSFSWTPAKSGNYRVELHVKDQYSNSEFDNKAFSLVTCYEPNIAKDAVLNVSDKLTVNKDYNLTASGKSANQVLYQFWIYDYSTSKWNLARDYSENSNFIWTPKKPGSYRIELHIKDKTSLNEFDDKSFKVVEAKYANPAQIVSFSIPDEGYLNRSIPITTSGSSENKTLYQYWIYDYSTAVWNVVKDYSEDASFNWTPTKLGNYRLEVHVKDQYSVNEFDNKAFKVISVYDPNVARDAVLNVGDKLTVNREYNLIASGKSGNQVLYQLWMYDYSTSKWNLIRDYSENSSFTWTPKKPGSYRIELHIKDKNSKSEFDDKSFKVVQAKYPEPAQIGSFSVPNEGYLNRTIGITTSGSSENKTLYQYWIYDYSTSAWNLVKDYSEDTSYNWTPTKLGNYRLEVHVKDQYSINEFDNKAFKVISVYDPNVARQPQLTMNDVYLINNSYNISGSASSGNQVLYQYWIYDYSVGTWSLAKDYSPDGTLSWKPSKSGSYRVELHVKDINSKNEFDDKAFKVVAVISNNWVGKTIVLDAGHGGSDSGAVGYGYLEKNLNITLTKKIGDLLSQIGVNVLYTRNPSNDVYVSLEDRAQFANDKKADLFISIHHDSSSSTSASGVSTHYSTYRPQVEVSGAYAIYNGKRYPYISEGDGGYYINYNGVSKFVSINDDITIYDETPCSAAQRSASFADQVASSLASLGFNNRGSRDHNLFVTRNTLMPSILIEAGFVSNQDEVKRVSDPAMENNFAQKIVECIKNFFTN